MKLVIMRHGEAAASYLDDFGRQLTLRGRDQVTAQSLELSNRLDVRQLQLKVSPYVRAQQTAELLTKVLTEQGIVIANKLETECAVITPSGLPVEVASELSALADSAPLVIVSHQPLVSSLIEYLTEVPVAMMPASVACLSFEVFGRGCGEIEWLVHSV